MLSIQNKYFQGAIMIFAKILPDKKVFFFLKMKCVFCALLSIARMLNALPTCQELTHFIKLQWFAF